MSRSVFWLPLALVLAACGGDEASAPTAVGEIENPPLGPVMQPERALSARMEDAWVLGKSAEGTFEPPPHSGPRPSMEGPEGVGPLLGRPIAVRSAPGDRVYVADKASLTIKVYDREGQVLGAFGGRGREPGELLTLSAMHVGRGGPSGPEAERLVVADGISMRFTAYAGDGSLETEAEYELKDLLWPRSLQQLASGELVFLTKMPPLMRDGQSRPDGGSLFHVYSEDLETKLGAFGPVEDFGLADRPIADAFSQVRPGHFWITRDDAVLYAPSLYRGLLHRYRRDEAGTWQRETTFQGFVAQEPSLLEVPPDEEQQHLHFKVTQGGIAMAARIRNESRGIFELSDGRIVHFSLQTVAQEDLGEEEAAAAAHDHHGHHGGPRDQVTFGVEVFSPEGELLGYGAVDTFTEHGHTEQFYVDWKDDQDRFYVREMTDRFVVWITTLEIL